MMSQYRFSTYLIKITVILTKVYVDITDLFLSLCYCVSTLAYSHFNSGVKMTDLRHDTTVRLCPGVSKLLVYSQQKCMYFGMF
jgi:hypothetical protein